MVLGRAYRPSHALHHDLWGGRAKWKADWGLRSVIRAWWPRNLQHPAQARAGGKRDEHRPVGSAHAPGVGPEHGRRPAVVYVRGLRPSSMGPSLEAFFSPAHTPPAHIPYTHTHPTHTPYTHTLHTHPTHARARCAMRSTSYRIHAHWMRTIAHPARRVVRCWWPCSFDACVGACDPMA